jgi:hypothetical protein
VSDNGDEGVAASRGVSLRDSTVTGNGEHGVSAGADDCSTSGPLKLRNATVTGNGLEPDCGVSVTCADLASCRSPKVGAGSTCGSSYVLASGFPGEDWSVCTSE